MQGMSQQRLKRVTAVQGISQQRLKRDTAVQGISQRWLNTAAAVQGNSQQRLKKWCLWWRKLKHQNMLHYLHCLHWTPETWNLKPGYLFISGGGLFLKFGAYF